MLVVHLLVIIPVRHGGTKRSKTWLRRLQLCVVRGYKIYTCSAVEFKVLLLPTTVYLLAPFLPHARRHTFVTAFVFARRRTCGDCKMKGAGGVAPEKDKAGGESAFKLRAPVSSEQREGVSLEKAVVKLMEENTGLKKDDAELSA